MTTTSRSRCSKVLGEPHGRRKAWRPRSIVNISAMSFGSLSANAIRALNMGAQQAGCYHNTGEGGLSPHHQSGGDVIYQIGTGLFGCRDLEGRFSMDKLLETVTGYPHVRGIEVKLSQGAKPGKGGVLPGKKVTLEIARIRGVRAGVDCISPNSNPEFSDVRTMIAFIERVADATGLPVGIKSAVGQPRFWTELAQAMRETGHGPDWITIDGGEGGTGAAPLTFADHVSLPFKVGFTRVYRAFLEEKMTERVAWIGSGKLGFPDRTIVAFSLGCDLVNIAREAMLSIGCIQAQRCHTDNCPAGVATQREYLQNGLKPEIAAVRFARFCRSLRNEILAVTHACGYEHPAQFTTDDIELCVSAAAFKPLRELFGYTPARGWCGNPGLWRSRNGSARPRARREPRELTRRNGDRTMREPTWLALTPAIVLITGLLSTAALAAGDAASPRPSPSPADPCSERVRTITGDSAKRLIQALLFAKVKPAIKGKAEQGLLHEGTETFKLDHLACQDTHSSTTRSRATTAPRPRSGTTREPRSWPTRFRTQASSSKGPRAIRSSWPTR